MKPQCPTCFTVLETVECAPCDDCGHLPEEIEHFKQEVHTYSHYEIYKGLTLNLCDFCAVDFGSYKSHYLGFPNNRRIGYENLRFVKAIDHPEIELDKYCPACNHRLNFLNFLFDLSAKIREEETGH